jgi:hypothetical protein
MTLQMWLGSKLEWDLADLCDTCHSYVASNSSLHSTTFERTKPVPPG